MEKNEGPQTNLNKQQIETLVIQQYKEDYKALEERISVLEKQFNNLTIPLYQEGNSQK